MMPHGYTMGVCPACGKPIYQLAKKAIVNQPRRRKAAANTEAVHGDKVKRRHAEASGASGHRRPA